MVDLAASGGWLVLAPLAVIALIALIVLCCGLSVLLLLFRGKRGKPPDQH